MTREEILTMKPGRELDALVHQHVMQRRILTREEMVAEAERVWKRQPEARFFLSGFRAYRAVNGDVICEQWFPLYSTVIEAAWQVVEEMIAYKTGSFCLINDEEEDMFWCHFGNCAYEACGTVPEAICKAALLAMLEEGGVQGER